MFLLYLKVRQGHVLGEFVTLDAKRVDDGGGSGRKVTKKLEAKG
jgi:hypothetical protein